MILYIQDENYHFDGYLSGVIIDNDKVALFKKEGIEEHNISIVGYLYIKVPKATCDLKVA